MNEEDYEEEFEEILKDLSRKPEKENNIYPYPAWEAIYCVAKRLGCPVRLMLCMVTDGGENLSGRENESGKTGETGEKEGKEETREIEEISEALRKAVSGMEGTEGIMSRYGKGQYLILLAGGDGEGCGAVQKEIEERLRERCPSRQCSFLTRSKRDEV